MGGCNTRNLVLGLMPVKYISVWATVYAIPVHPVLVAPVGTTQREIIRLRDDYKRDISLFYEVTDFEKAVIKQNFQAIYEI